ncbi:hypothetical protein [Winogradskyella ludwigii]|uniref:hypothetical protein n=1 Tax=Winogradskyella ludwigii TaxID=2686076 RepID=UPI0015CABA6B|nr:hypothetical protein [Winogradskyella ludwigii]
MKTHVLGLIALGLTNLMIAQNDIAEVTNSDAIMYSKSKSINTVANLNSEYLSLASHDGVAIVVKKIQKIVANYDIKTADVYLSNRNTTYTVNFMEGGNTVEAVYNKAGKIISCKEYYNDIRLPYNVSTKIAKQYPGWSFDKIKCEIVYAIDKASLTTYKITIKKERKSKNVTITI